jgi:hypothetical protein
MADLVPLFGMLTGIAITGLFFWSFVKVAQGPVGQALGRRILGRHAQDPEAAHEVADLRERIDLLASQLAEVEERLDFAERLLAQVRTEPRALGPADPRTGGPRSETEWP